MREIVLPLFMLCLPLLSAPHRYAPGLTGNEQRLYEFVVRHFLACLSADAQGMETTVDVEVAAEKVSLCSRGGQRRVPGRWEITGRSRAGTRR